MECPYCGAELVWVDSYGVGIYYTSSYQKRGDIYTCPNSEGFDDEELAKEYKDANEELKSTPLEEVSCESYIFNGYFYDDIHGNLYEGYPC